MMIPARQVRRDVILTDRGKFRMRLLGIALLAALCSVQAWAQGEIFADDFETGTICRWSSAAGGACTCFDPILGLDRPLVKPALGQIKISEWMPDPALVSDSFGEWFEVRALATVDLNGLQAGTTLLLLDPIVPYGANCMALSPGTYALFARNSDSGLNGFLPPVDVVFNFSLLNTSGSLQIGIDGATLSSWTWQDSTSGKSWQLDESGTLCLSYGSTYNGTDYGTPKAGNVPCLP